MKIIVFILIAFAVVFSFYGFLVLKEYGRYFVRLLRIKLDRKLKKSAYAPSDAEVHNHD